MLDNGGIIDWSRIVVLEPDMPQADRWVIDAWTELGTVFRLKGEWPSHAEAVDALQDMLAKLAEQS